MLQQISFVLIHPPSIGNGYPIIDDFFLRSGIVKEFKLRTSEAEEPVGMITLSNPFLVSLDNNDPVFGVRFEPYKTIVYDLEFTSLLERVKKLVDALPEAFLISFGVNFDYSLEPDKFKSLVNITDKSIEINNYQLSIKVKEQDGYVFNMNLQYVKEGNLGLNHNFHFELGLLRFKDFQKRVLLENFNQLPEISKSAMAIIA